MPHSAAGPTPDPLLRLVLEQGPGMRRKAAEAAVAAAAAVEPPATSSSGDAGPVPARSRSSQTWAMLIKRVYEIDPLTCARCGGQMKVVAFLDPPQADVIEKILAGTVAQRWSAACGVPRRHGRRQPGTAGSTTRMATPRVTRPPTSPGS